MTERCPDCGKVAGDIHTCSPRRITDRKLMQQALEALDKNAWAAPRGSELDAVYVALRERLAREEQNPSGMEEWQVQALRAGWRMPARQEQEPVAWGWRAKDGQIYDCITPEEHAREAGNYTVPLYTAPQPREWRGLTDVERIDLGVISEAVSAHSLIGMVEAALKAKNV